MLSSMPSLHTVESCRQMSLHPGPPYALWCCREDWYIILKGVVFLLSPSGSRLIVRVYYIIKKSCNARGASVRFGI